MYRKANVDSQMLLSLFRQQENCQLYHCPLKEFVPLRQGLAFQTSSLMSGRKKLANATVIWNLGSPKSWRRVRDVGPWTHQFNFHTALKLFECIELSYSCQQKFIINGGFTRNLQKIVPCNGQQIARIWVTYIFYINFDMIGFFIAFKIVRSPGCLLAGFRPFYPIGLGIYMYQGSAETKYNVLPIYLGHWVGSQGFKWLVFILV